MCAVLLPPGANPISANKYIYIYNFYAVRDTDISRLCEILVVADRTCVRELSVVIMNGTYQPPYVEHLPIFMVCSGVLLRLQANYDAALSKTLPSRIWTNRVRKWTWLRYSRLLSCVNWRWRMWRYERHAGTITMNVRVSIKSLQHVGMRLLSISPYSTKRLKFDNNEFDLLVIWPLFFSVNT